MITYPYPNLSWPVLAKGFKCNLHIFAAELDRGDDRVRQRTGGDSGWWWDLPHHWGAGVGGRGRAEYTVSHALVRSQWPLGSFRLPGTLRCRYDAVNLFENCHNGHTIVRPSGRGTGCTLWVETLIYAISKSTQCCMKYNVILNRVITASPDYSWLI